MRPVRFIHAADLHLDTAFSALSLENPKHLAKNLHQATFTALDRLMALCEREKPDFLILAGDAYNQEDHSLRAQIALKNGCEKLARLKIRVFVVHGNRDPLGSRLQSLNWPPNVKFFGPTLETEHVWDENGQLICVVHGISYQNAKEQRNLAASFRRTPDVCPQIGILHTSLNTSAADGAYAPGAPENLQASGLDYWALGHVHQYALASVEPLAIYPGSLQGLRIDENGPHGCVSVVLEQKGNRGKITARHEFVSLAPLAWHDLELDLEKLIDEKADDPNDLTLIDRLIRDAASKAVANLWPECRIMLIRVRLVGRTILDHQLRRYSVQNELLDLLLEDLGNGNIEIRLKDLLVETRPAFDREISLKREDLLGEILRQADQWRKNPELLEHKANTAFAALLGRVRSPALISADSPQDLQELLTEAERICSDYLENN